MKAKQGVWLVAVVAVVAVVGCEERPQVEPFVQFPATTVADVTVQVDADGRFAPTCVNIEAGETVQWVNRSVLPNVTVTGLGHSELFSPVLAGRYSTWSHRFGTAGRFEYFDSNSGNPGRPVADDYYGTVTYIGTGDSVTRGMVCVEHPAAAMQPRGSCESDAGCAEDEECNADGRCQLRPLCRNFCCPLGVECSAGYVCNPENQQCEPAPSFCVRDGDCPGNKVCGPRGECVVECITSDDCRYGTVCEGQVCQPAVDVGPGTNNGG